MPGYDFRGKTSLPVLVESFMACLTGDALRYGYGYGGYY
jgi:hypothetical protein